MQCSSVTTGPSGTVRILTVKELSQCSSALSRDPDYSLFWFQNILSSLTQIGRSLTGDGQGDGARGVQVMGEMKANDEAARGRMAQAQAQQETAANRYRREEGYAVGEQVMLSTKHLLGYKHKLACRFIGPFPIVEVGVGTVRLDLPRDMKVHDRVNVDKVKRYSPSVGEWPGRSQESRPLPVHVSDDGQGEYEVEAILGKREGMEPPPSSPSQDPSFTVVSGRRKVKEVIVTRYLVQWKGYSADECSWERVANLEGAMDLVVDYERRLEAESTGRPSVMMLVVSG